MADPNIRQTPPIFNGTTVLVQGRIRPNTVRFNVNLCTAADIFKGDIAIHVNPRYDEGNAVIRNSFVNGVWGGEERDGPAFTVPTGGNVEILLLIRDDVIKFAYNGQHYSDYKHRIPKERIRYVITSGELQVTNITFFGPGLPNDSYGGQFPYPLQYQPRGGYYTQPSIGYPVPTGYLAPGGTYDQPRSGMTPSKYFIPGGLSTGRLVFITFTSGPLPTSQWIHVSFRLNESDGDVPFYFNPRFNWNGDKNVTVRNSLLAGSWGAEERDQPSFPFAIGKVSQLIILADEKQFKVAVDNKDFTQYQYRTSDLAAIQWIEVNGDVSNVSIHVQ